MSERRNQHVDDPAASNVASAGTVSGVGMGTPGGVIPDPVARLPVDSTDDVPDEVEAALDEIGDDEQASPGAVGAKIKQNIEGS